MSQPETRVAVGQGVADAVVTALGRRIVVSPTLRSVISGLPAGSATRTQVESVAALIVMNVWLFCRDYAIAALEEVEAASRGALPVVPRGVTVPLGPDGAPADLARTGAASVAARLGFSPMGRTRVMNACGGLATSVQAQGGVGQLTLQPDARARAITAVARYLLPAPASPAEVDDRFRSVRADGCRLHISLQGRQVTARAGFQA